MKKILITRKLIKESEEKASKTFDPIFNNNDEYNANKRTLQTIKPNISNYEVNIKLNEKSNTWICYWAAEYTNDFMKIKSAKEAYNTFKNV